MQPDDISELLEITEIQQALVDVRADLRFESDDTRTLRARIEQSAIDKAGSEKAFGSSAEVRERKLLLVLGDDQEYQEKRRRLKLRERKADNLQVRYDAAIRALRREEWLTRQGLIDALNALATRPCYLRMDHDLSNMMADMTGENGIYAGGSDYVADASVS